MPLLVLTGWPCVGKTTRSVSIRDYFINIKFSVFVVNDESLNVSKKTDYSSVLTEKKTRSNVLSAVERLLTKDVLVIVDGVNEIKGFRYQLYCIARAIGTPHSLIHVGGTREVCAAINSSRSEDWQYPLDVLHSLIDRYEEPDFSASWDRPLVFVQEGNEIPMERLKQVLIDATPPPPNFSTMNKPPEDITYLTQIEQITNKVIEMWNRPNSGNRTMSIAESRRHKRQFMNQNKLHPIPIQSVERAFNDYLSNVANQ